MKSRYQCLTSARFELRPSDTTLDIRALIDHTNLQVFFGGGRVQLTAPWPGVASGGGRIVDVALYGAGGGGLRGSLEAFGMGSIWVSADEVLRRRDAMDLALGTRALKSDDPDGEAGR